MSNDINPNSARTIAIQNMNPLFFLNNREGEKILENIQEAMIQYAKIKCKEQRDICDEARHYQTGVSNAPEPTFD